MLNISRLRTLQRFAGVSDETLQLIAQKAERMTVPKGTPIIEIGSEAIHACIVKKGSVKIWRPTEDGAEQALEISTAGESFGEISVLNGSRYIISATALTDCVYIRIKRNDYLDLLKSNLEFALSTVTELSLLACRMGERIEDLGSTPVEQRIAKLFLSIGTQEDADPDILTIKLSRQEIASIVSARLETVVRRCSHWVKLGVLQQAGYGVVKASRTRLREYVTSRSF